MTIMLNWTTSSTPTTIIHAASVADSAAASVKASVEAATDQAVALLKNNIQDDSLYLLFEWNADAAKLTILVTDASKTQDAPELVCCSFPMLALEASNSDARGALTSATSTDSVKFWLHDYLTTCTAFFSYSLVAIFHSSTRSNTELL
jgi:hypothetical protein